mgnify:CR=1 FL=1
MDRFDAMRAFARVVEAGSFTKAAQTLHMSKTTVTQLIQQLEARLRVLIRRERRQVGSEVLKVGDLVLDPASLRATRGGTELLRGLHEVLDDHRAGHGGDQQVRVHVETVGLQRGHAVLARELVPGISHVRLDRAAVQSALADGLQVLATLSHVHGHGHAPRDHVRVDLSRDSWQPDRQK